MICRINNIENAYVTHQKQLNFLPKFLCEQFQYNLK